MNDTSTIDTSIGLGIPKLSGTQQNDAAGPKRYAVVRGAAGTYLALTIVTLLLSVWCFRRNNDLDAFALWLIAFIVVPVCSLLERVSFDGKRLARKGPLAFISRRLLGRRNSIELAEIEAIHSNAARTVRSGGRLYYRFRTEVQSSGLTIEFTARSKAYRRMVHALFPLVPDEKLDMRSVELRNFLCEPEMLRLQLSVLNFAPASVLNSASSILSRSSRRGPKAVVVENGQILSIERAMALRQVANELRVVGRLREAAEAFRRAAPSLKGDPTFTLEFARLLRFSSSGSKERVLGRRAIAALRLAASRSAEKPELLTRIGETFVEMGQIPRAKAAFERALLLSPGSFRASIGLADIALRDGKLAHAIHQFRGAARESSDHTLVQHAESEAIYFGMLSDDDEYLERELVRMSWLENFERFRVAALKFALAAALVAMVGPAIDDSLAGPGWTATSIGAGLWILSLFGKRFLSERRTFPKIA